MSYYVYPDGTITEEPLSFMSDDGNDPSYKNYGIMVKW